MVRTHLMTAIQCLVFYSLSLHAVPPTSDQWTEGRDVRARSSFRRLVNEHCDILLAPPRITEKLNPPERAITSVRFFIPDN